MLPSRPQRGAKSRTEDHLLLVAVIFVLLSVVEGLSDLCACGSFRVPATGAEDVGQLTEWAFPRISGHHRDIVADAIRKCNPGIGSTPVGAGRDVILPCIFPTNKNFRLELSDQDFSKACSCKRSHTIEEGESLWDIIAAEYPEGDPVISGHLLLGCNAALNPYHLDEGQTIQLHCLQDLDELFNPEQDSSLPTATARSLLVEKSQHKQVYVTEGCPACDVTSFEPPARVRDEDLFVCGCGDKCADCAVNFVNGCGSAGSPAGRQFGDLFGPACFAHDACYSCGDVFFEKELKSVYERRRRCDDLLLENMQKRCDLAYPDQGMLHYTCRLFAATSHCLVRVTGGSFFRTKCKCPKGWSSYVENMFLLDFCVEPVRKDFGFGTRHSVNADGVIMSMLMKT